MHKSSLAAAMRAVLASWNCTLQELERRRVERRLDEYVIKHSNDTRFTTNKPTHNPRNNRKTKKGGKK